MTDDPDIRMAQSIVDYIFRRLALDYLSYDEREALGIFTADERRLRWPRAMADPWRSMWRACRNRFPWRGTVSRNSLRP